MTRHLKPYENYKDTGLFYLGRVPKHWKIVRNKYVFSERNLRSETGEEELLSLSQYTGVTRRRNRSLVGKGLLTNAETLKGYKIVREDDLVMNIMLAWNGSLGVSRYMGIISPAYCVYEINDRFNPWYFHYLLKTDQMTTAFKALSTGVIDSRLRLYPEKFYQLFTVIPAKEEQDQIVRFLDDKVSKINRLIRAKKKQIELLKEKKEAVIFSTVTKGLESSREMKPSGIGWFERIPKDWEMRQLGRMAKTVKTGQTPEGAATEYYADNGFNWFTPSDFGESMYLEKSTRQLSGLGKQKQIFFPKDTVMMVGIGATLGKVALSQREASCNQQVNAIVCTSEIEPMFLAYYLRANRSNIMSMAKYTTLPILNQNETKRIPVVHCSRQEQREIVKYIDDRSRLIDEAIKQIKTEISLMVEYRTAVISQVVTGKIDVRGIEIEDPVHFEEDLDELDEGELENLEIEKGGGED